MIFTKRSITVNEADNKHLNSNSGINKLPAIILFAGAVVRIAGTGSSAIWYDEAVSLYRTHLPFMALYNDLSEYSGCLLLDLILRPIMLVGHSVWLLRLPAMLAGLITLWLIWKLMRWFKLSLFQQSVTAILAAFLPGLLWMSQDARVYSLLTLLLLAGFWFALEGQFLGMLAACGLIAYAHNIGPAYAIGIFFVALIRHPWKFKQILQTGFYTGLAWSPSLFHAWQLTRLQTFINPPLSISTFFYPWMVSFWTFALGNGWILLFAFILLLVTVIMLAIVGWRTPWGKTLTAFWATPVITIILISALWQNVIMYRTLMPAIFPFLLWLGYCLPQRPSLNFKSFLAYAWILFAGLGLVGWDPGYRGGELDKIATQIRNDWRSGDRIIYLTATAAIPFDYYLGDLPHVLWTGASNPFLSPPGLDFPSSDTLDGGTWYILPTEDRLFTPDEQANIQAHIADGHLIAIVTYFQAAAIQVYRR
jgi:hypothetical protein